MDEEEFSAAIKRVGGLMEPWQGALPSLYASVSDEAKGAELYGPDKDGGYRGYPAKAEINTVSYTHLTCAGISHRANLFPKRYPACPAK